MHMCEWSYMYSIKARFSEVFFDTCMKPWTNKCRKIKLTWLGVQRKIYGWILDNHPNRWALPKMQPNKLSY